MAFKRSAVRSRLSPPLRCAEYFYIDRFIGSGFFVFGDNMNTIENEYKAYTAIEAIQKLSAFSRENGLDNMSLEEINAEIEAARADRSEQSE